MRHEDLTRNHILERWVYANAAARTTATGFTSIDVGKIAYQSDTGRYWRLMSIAPTWNPIEPTAVTLQAQSVNPTGTTNTTGVMMGLAHLFTPVRTGKVLITISGTIKNSGAAGPGGKVQIYHGTGATPANGAALTGTADGSNVRYIQAASAQEAPFSIQVIVSALALGTVYWVDVALAAITSGTVNITDLSTSIIEL